MGRKGFMGSAALDARNSPDGPDRKGRPPPSGNERFDREFLEKVLERALLSPSESEAVLPEDIDALTAVARQRREEPFSLPVAVELVKAILQSFFGCSTAAPPSGWRLASEDVARTLFEDPVLSERLRSLWLRLLEES
jgi:hypothetical protein